MLTLVTAAAECPVTLSEACAHLRIEAGDGYTTGDDDTYVNSLIQAATSYLDGKNGILLGRCMIKQTWSADIEDTTVDFKFPLITVTKINKITYKDENEAAKTLSSTLYTLYDDTIEWEEGLPYMDDVKVEFEVGYGDADDVPAPLKHAILLLIGHWYDNRNAVTGTNMSSVPTAFDALISAYRAWRI